MAEFNSVSALFYVLEVDQNWLICMKAILKGWSHLGDSLLKLYEILPITQKLNTNEKIYQMFKNFETPMHLH